MCLMCCPNLKSIEAEWNFLELVPMGLEALCHLIKDSRFVEFVDLKNNRINTEVIGVNIESVLSKELPANAGMAIIINKLYK